ncbi:Peptidyl-tRNA hydrolase ICT1, mitochondrial isoform X3 [Aix galericulata]|nr:Peptidyl-tRNA hydrolase ICT1, mitochondrial isoform X3 [Aix galericulata]
MAARTLRALYRPRLLAAAFSGRAAAGAEFRSAYSLDKLYPPRGGGGGGDTGSEQEAKPPALDIPMDRLTVSYCRSSGPGGQNVNKVNTKAEVRFHLASADWIPEAVRQKMASMHKNKINRAGELIVNSEESRYQMRNLAICLEKIRVMVTEATEKPKVVSKETAQELIARAPVA